MSTTDFGATFERAPGGLVFYFVSTPAVLVNDLPRARMVSPFVSHEEAEWAASLLNDRYPESTCFVGSMLIDQGRLEDLDSSAWPIADRLEFRRQEARGDLAALLAGIPLGELGGVA